jgi:hypothetical protein
MVDFINEYRDAIMPWYRGLAGTEQRPLKITTPARLDATAIDTRKPIPDRLRRIHHLRID